MHCLCISHQFPPLEQKTFSSIRFPPPVLANYSLHLFSTPILNYHFTFLALFYNSSCGRQLKALVLFHGGVGMSDVSQTMCGKSAKDSIRYKHCCLTHPFYKENRVLLSHAPGLFVLCSCTKDNEFWASASMLATQEKKLPDPRWPCPLHLSQRRLQQTRRLDVSPVTQGGCYSLNGTNYIIQTYHRTLKSLLRLYC